MERATLTRVWRAARWALVALVLAVIVRRAMAILAQGPSVHNVPFREWYGDWGEVAVVSAIFLAFLLGFARPRRRAEWRNAGVYSAFLISLFAEMFGVPLTIYLVAPALGVPATMFGMNESHLWAFALDRLGWLPLRWGVFAVMAISTVLIAAGLGLLMAGWATVYRGRGGLVTGGIYRWLRHPQYLGLILVVVAFTLMWPTGPTLVMAPVLVVMYVRLARREDRELAARFGWGFAAYAARTPAFLPGGRGRLDPAVWPIAWKGDAPLDPRSHSTAASDETSETVRHRQE